MKNVIIGIDIGGTKIATGIVSSKGILKDSVVVPTNAKKGLKASLGQVMSSVNTIIQRNDLKHKDIKGIGACAPGPLDPLKGIVQNPPNLPGWKKVPLADILKKEFKVKTKLENDANAAGLAEMFWGAAKGYKNIFYVTVSTGIGSGVIINGQIYHGKNGMAGEGGHVSINYDEKGNRCGCGSIGCIESLASGPSTVKRLIRSFNPNSKNNKIIKIAGGNIKNITMVTLAKAAKQKDPIALKTIREQGKLIGIWLGSMINVLDPEIIVIGGGVSMIGELIFKEIRDHAISHSLNVYASKTPIVRAKLKTDVGIYGAASVIM